MNNYRIRELPSQFVVSLTTMDHSITNPLSLHSLSHSILETSYTYIPYHTLNSQWYSRPLQRYSIDWWIGRKVEEGHTLSFIPTAQRLTRITPVKEFPDKNEWDKGGCLTVSSSSSSVLSSKRVIHSSSFLLLVPLSFLVHVIKIPFSREDFTLH